MWARLIPFVTLWRWENSEHDGPFQNMRAELGIQDNGMRFRVKLDYALLDGDASNITPPPLHLRTLTVCRETLDGYWPNPEDNGKKDAEGKYEVSRRNQEIISEALFGDPGAEGGLYDPPPVGSEEQATKNYMLLDFEGSSTLLMPHRIDQHNEEDCTGWVTSLDWDARKGIRYQVDRKVFPGSKLKGLRTLELSEVLSRDANKWRPKDGGVDMRQ